MKAEKLLKRIKQIGIPQSRIAKALKISTTSLSFALKGRRKTAKYMQIIERTETYLNTKFK